MPLPVGLIDDGPHFFESECRDIIECPVRLHLVAPVGIHFDPVGAVIDLLAHGAAGAVRAIRF